MKRFLTMGLSLLLVLSLLSGCGGNQASKTEDDTNTTTKETSKDNPKESSTTPTDTGSAAEQKIVFALHNVPDGLDPVVTNNSFAMPFLDNCFEGLVTSNANNELIPALAESWTVSEDGKTYTFTLRDGLKWSDGSPLTSADFMYSFERTLKPET